jgi:hypothetical protein
MHESHTQESRALPIDIYFPTDGDKKQLFPYKTNFYKALADYYAKQSVIPRFIWRQLVSNIQSHAHPNASISNVRFVYPVILFSPGIGAAQTYATYIEDLVSHGYIVVEMQHPYDLEVSVFPDGRIIEMDSAFAQAIKKTDRDFIYPYRGRAHWRWLADAQFVLSELERLNNDPSFALHNKLDLNRIGILGNSHGGAMAIDLVKKDSRVKAGINADGWTKTANTYEPFNKPFMFLWADVPGEYNGQELYDNMKKINKDVSAVVIPGAGHGISDWYLLKWPFGPWHGAEPIVRQTQEKIRNFFDRYIQ